MASIGVCQHANSVRGKKKKDSLAVSLFANDACIHTNITADHGDLVSKFECVPGGEFHIEAVTYTATDDVSMDNGPVEIRE